MVTTDDHLSFRKQEVSGKEKDNPCASKLRSSEK